MERTEPRPTYVTIDLPAIRNNVRRMREICITEVMAVVKANAYGHGAVPVAQAAQEAGATWLGVAFSAEGMQLRRSGIKGNTLILGYTPPELAAAAVEADLSMTVFDLHNAEEFARAGRSAGKNARLHLKIDTGMGRLGAPVDEAVDLARKIGSLAGVELEGVYTHFATADEEDASFSLRQLNSFQEVLQDLEAAGLRPRWVHTANSAAALRFPAARLDMVRMGIALYGLNPGPDTPVPVDFQPALAWKSTITQVREYPPGTSISYGRRYFTRGYERIAVVPVGYADGYRRTPNGDPQVLVRGSRVPVVGRICMDQMMVNVSDVAGVETGDEVVLIGRQGENEIPADEVAGWWGTINYEVVSGIMARVPRVYSF